MELAQNHEAEELLAAYKGHFESLDWRDLVANVEPKATGCGPVYELGQLLDRPNQDAAIADMRAIKFATPHYHANGETESYIVLEGSGRVVVGGKELPLDKGTIVITPPNTAHYVSASEGLVLAVINTPPFNLSNAVDLTESNAQVGYDHEQFKKLTREEV